MSLKQKLVVCDRETGVSTYLGIAHRELGRKYDWGKEKGAQATRDADPLDQWRKVVKARAGGLCQMCGWRGEECHHLYETGTARFRHLRHDERNGLYLCRPCHQTGPDAAHNDLPAFRAMAAIEFPWFTPLFEEQESKAIRPNPASGVGGAS